MKLSRKRRRELKHLRANAQTLLEEQKIVLGQAGIVLNEASRQAKHLSDEHLAPRIDKTLETVRPKIDRGITSARRAALTVRRATAPFVTAALATTIAKLDELEQRQAAIQVRTFGERVGYLPTARRKRSGMRTFGVIVGITAAVGVGYTLLQAFRSDDDLWIAPETTE